MTRSVLEIINNILAWKGYKPELTPHIEELKQIADKAGRRERITDREMALITELDTMFNS